MTEARADVAGVCTAYYPNHGVAVAVQVNSEVDVNFAAVDELADAAAGELWHP